MVNISSDVKLHGDSTLVVIAQHVVLHVLDHLGVIEPECRFHFSDGLRLLQHILADLGLVAEALEHSLVAGTVGIFER